MISDFLKKFRRQSQGVEEQKTKNVFEKYSPPERKEIELRGDNVKEDIKRCHEKFCGEYFIFLGDANEVIRKRNNEIYSIMERLNKLGLEKSQNYEDLRKEKKENEKTLRNNTNYELRLKFKKRLDDYRYLFYYLSFNDFSKLIETYGYSYPTVFKNFTGRLDEKAIGLLETIYKVGSDLVNVSDNYYYGNNTDTDVLMRTRSDYKEDKNEPIYRGDNKRIIEISQMKSNKTGTYINLDPEPVIVIKENEQWLRLPEDINYSIPVFNKSIDYMKDKLKDDYSIKKISVVDSHRPLVVKKNGLPSILFHIWTEGVLVYGFI